MSRLRFRRWAAVRPVVLLHLALGLAALAGCSDRPAGYVKIKGSETVLPISLKLAERFKDHSGETAVSVSAGGSGVGIASLMQQNTDIAMSSRQIKFNEKIRFLDRGLDVHERIVAYDALAVIVNPANPLDTLSLAQLKRIYTGEVTNWQALGGRDEPIVAFNRASSSGTYGFFQKTVLGGDRFGKLQSVGANGDLVEKVRDNPQAIGYVGIAYIDSSRSKPLKIHNPELGRAVTPSLKSALSGRYPLTRPLFYYFLPDDRQRIQPVLDFLLSPAGQRMVMSVGYVPNQAYYSPDDSPR